MLQNVAVVGLGYVGLPLACLFTKSHNVVGYDLKADRVKNLRKGVDTTGEVSVAALSLAIERGIRFTTDINELRDSNVFIVAVPTPVDDANKPDLTPLIGASKAVGSVLKQGDLVVYESTVYPGVTEEVCVPLLEEASGLRFNVDFTVGYSPERINPGDQHHTVSNTIKITSGSTPQAAEAVDRLYRSVLSNGTFKASSIRVAEAAKMVENTQRDVNIALMNELAKIFNAMGISISDVLEAASTKWNFMKVHPGLVGGHCIGVDPYYLIQRANEFGVKPALITEARHINDTMGQYVADHVTDLMALNGVDIADADVLVMGFTFKPDCRDIRNTRSYDVYTTMVEKGARSVTVFDPLCDSDEVKRHYGIDIVTDVNELVPGKYHAIIICVNHHVAQSVPLAELVAQGGVVYSVNKAQMLKNL